MEEVFSRCSYFLDYCHCIWFIEACEIEEVGVLVELVEYGARSIFYIGGC